MQACRNKFLESFTNRYIYLDIALVEQAFLIKAYTCDISILGDE